MSDLMDRVEGSSTKFKLGDNIHFEISSSSSAKNQQQQQPSVSKVTSHYETTNSNKKKKKKHKKKSKAVSPSTIHAHLNHPEDDYPTSRVIKQAPNGDVIVESLDHEDHDEDDEEEDDDEEYHNHHHQHQHHHHDHGECELHSHNHQRRKSSSATTSVNKPSTSSTNLWDSASIEEQERLKEFWESLGESKKLELVRIDKDSIMKMFKSETRQHLQQNNSSSNNNNSGTSNGSGSGGNNGCTCKYCGRRNNIIEEELESIYDNHFDDIIDFIHEVRDINDLNALPGLLFGGFHMLEEERRLQKRQQQAQQHPVISTSNESTKKQQSPPPPPPPQATQLQQEQQQVQNEMKVHFIQEQMEKFKSHIEKLATLSNQPNDPSSSTSSSAEIHLRASFDESEITNNGNATMATQVFDKLLDPKLFEALENMDLDKMKEFANLDPTNTNNVHILEKATSLREIVRDLNNVDRANLQKGMTHVSNMNKFFSNISNLNTNNPSDISSSTSTSVNKLDDQLSNFAEDLLKNDGNSFIGMMEALSESRSAREELVKEAPSQKNASTTIYKTSASKYAWIDEDDKVEIEVHTCNNPHHHHHHPHDDDEEDEDDDEEEDEDDDEYDEDDEDDYDDEDDEEEYDDEEDEDEEEDEEEDASDTESEISEEEKMQEIRRLFLIQVIKLFQERLKNAYKEKLSQDRTQKLIEELEAEENAKKERELKKLKQKEKAKEKKRLQQLAKEEERKRKEEELKQKEEEQRLQKEKLKAEQKKRKEEQKLKREEEKKKRIEELKRKEEEHRKKVEAQQKREEEAKKLKEERKRKAEEERKQKEEEKKQKELLRKQKEAEKRQKELLLKKQQQEQEEEELRRKEEQEEAERLRKQSTQFTDDVDLVKQIEQEATKLSNMSSIDGTNQQLLNHLYPGSIPTTPSSAGFPTLTGGGPAHLLNQAQPYQQQQQQPVQPQLQSSLASAQRPAQQFQYSSEFIPTGFQNNPSLLNQPIMNSSPQPGNLNMLNGSAVGPSLAGGNNLSPWSSKSRLNSLSNINQPQPPQQAPAQQQQQQQPFSQFIPQGTSAVLPTDVGSSATTNSGSGAGGAPPAGGNFSPFNAFSDPLSADTFMSTPVSGNSNIWMNSSKPSASGVGVVPSNGSATSRNNSIWSNETTPMLNTAANGGVGSGIWNNNNNVGLNGTEIELIQSATFNCFQILQNSGQLEFGVAPLVKIFQNVKSILNRPTLSINQYLSCFIGTSSIYQFNLKYDDFGNVSHIKAGLLSNNNNGLPRTSPPLPQPPQSTQNQVPTIPPQNHVVNLPPGFNSSPPGLFNETIAGNNPPSFLAPIGELTSTTTLNNTNGNNNNNGFGRRLWN
ncbi:NST1 Stress response protein NST1 [Candida maltosa Xu316]